MKRKLSYIIMSLLIGGVMLSPAVAIAHEGTGASSSGSNTVEHSTLPKPTGDSTNDDSSDDTTKVETETHDMPGRIEKFKTQFKIKLGVAEIARLKLRCVGAQGVVGKLHTRIGNSVTVRTKAYDELQKRLDNLVTKLKAKDVDTTTLETQITELKAKIATYATDLAAYKQALSDLKDVDCKADPNGFQAALLAARSAHDKVVADVLAIRAYLVGTIKPTLKLIKQQLESTEAKDKDSSQTNDSSNSSSGGSN